MGKTSSTVKKRYNDKVYTHINVAIPKDLAERFKAKCAASGDSQAGVIKEAIERYLDDKTDDK